MWSRPDPRFRWRAGGDRVLTPSPAPDVDVARQLVAMVRHDEGVPASARSRASRIDAGSPVALRDLDNLHEAFAPTIVRRSPTTSLARCVSVETFHMWHLREDVHLRIQTHAAYRRWVDRAPDPSALLLADLKSDPTLFPARFSWLIPQHQVRGRRGAQLKTRLRLRPTDQPPFIVFLLPLSRLDDAGVGVRVPCALDAIPGRNVQWTSAGVSGEFVDGDVPRASLKEIQWCQ